ncbi:hypothetical protein DFH08DRAFT_827032 [Mycena albidolilacea]|uniref:Uncharacterized protein n=1 Tax=Mycena albidolilacea TaxID=1033008 RepID=A0AAD6YZN7_9AGAR|nr:hypothetical protein DFH08DRAFT_827032 [Mycena albidolilacea]
MACQADKMACKPFCRAWAGDPTQIHAPARNKPFGAGASHFGMPKRSAVVAAWMTPTVGLGCHSASFLLYGGLSTISFITILAGEIITQRHHSTNPQSYSLSASSHTRHVNLSVLCGRVGKIIAWVNACMFIALDLLRFANIFDNCFCGSSVMGRGAQHAFNIVSYDPSMHFENWWISSIAFATMAAFSLWIAVFVLKTSKKPSLATS